MGNCRISRFIAIKIITVTPLGFVKNVYDVQFGSTAKMLRVVIQ